MSAVNPLPLISVDEYLEGEKSSLERHEYIDGQVFAMSGSSIRHNLLTGNLFAMLRGHVRGTSCSVFSNDLKVAVSPTIYYYPDISVTRSPLQQAEYLCPEPILIFEVLSPSTEQIDRREKAKLYKEITSLREYVIVDQKLPSVEVHRRSATGEWEILQFSEGDLLQLNSIDLSLSFADLYSGIQFTTEN